MSDEDIHELRAILADLTDALSCQCVIDCAFAMAGLERMKEIIK